MSAEQACGEYEFWASEVRRLTDDIGAVRCPREDPDDDWNTQGSHFSEACDITVPADWLADEGRPSTRRIRLEEIATRVADCPRCSELVNLIRARRYARKQFGIAKRRVRAIGKRVIAATPEVSHG